MNITIVALNLDGIMIEMIGKVKVLKKISKTSMMNAYFAKNLDQKH